MKNITNYLIDESRAEDHLDFKSILDDFLINTDIKNWTTPELYEYCEEEDLSNQESDEFVKWVLKNYKKLFNTSYPIKDKENYQKKLKKQTKKDPTFKFQDSFGHVIKYMDKVIFFDEDSKTFKRGWIIDLNKKIGTIKLHNESGDWSDDVAKVEQFYILRCEKILII